jgi:hypothetical protein
LYWLDTAGKIVRHERVPFHPQPPKSPAQERIEEIARIREIAIIAVVAPSPLTDVAIIMLKELPGRCEMEYYPIYLRFQLERLWPILPITAAVSVVLAVLCYRRQRKYGLPWTAVWTVFVLLFGLPAYFGYLAHRAWPARLPCPNCGRRVPRDRPACTGCGRDFPPPALKGTEVFA